MAVLSRALESGRPEPALGPPGVDPTPQPLQLLGLPSPQPRKEPMGPAHQLSLIATTIHPGGAMPSPLLLRPADGQLGWS